MNELQTEDGDRIASFNSYLSARNAYMNTVLTLPVDDNPLGNAIINTNRVEYIYPSNRLATQHWHVLQALQKLFTHALPTDPIISYLSQYDELVELGAGTGYFAYLLEQAGVDVAAFDTNQIDRLDNPMEPESEPQMFVEE